jgi:hypothetical protein
MSTDRVGALMVPRPACTLTLAGDYRSARGSWDATSWTPLRATEYLVQLFHVKFKQYI